MNKLLLLGAVALVLTACGKPGPIESVESLVADPARLRHLLNWAPRHDDIDFIVSSALSWEKARC